MPPRKPAPADLPIKVSISMPASVYQIIRAHHYATRIPIGRICSDAALREIAQHNQHPPAPPAPPVSSAECRAAVLDCLDDIATTMLRRHAEPEPANG
jgi:hypothetical protein